MNCVNALTFRVYVLLGANEAYTGTLDKSRSCDQVVVTRSDMALNLHRIKDQMAMVTLFRENEFILPFSYDTARDVCKDIMCMDREKF